MKLRTSLFRRKPDLWSASTLVLALAATTAAAADRSWSGGAASYNTPANWTGGIVPGATDTAINDNGANNAVQINVGDPDWALNQLQAGKAGSGAFLQNGQTLSLTNSLRGIRLGTARGSSGAYTLNGGTINYGGDFAVGEAGRGTLNINGGSIAGRGNFAVTMGSSIDAVNATIDQGLARGGHTWFERGFYPADPNRGLPPAGSSFTHESLPDHSYTMPSSYAGNCVVLIGGGLNSGTVTLTTPTACSSLSLLGSAGNGDVTINYTVHYAAPGTTETGTLVVPDWWANLPTIALRPGGRVRADGLDFQIGDPPRLFSIDIALNDTVHAVSSIDLTYVSGGVAGLLALSGYNAGAAAFAPLAISGYNADAVLEAGAPIYVANTVTNILNQAAGTIDITGEMWVGNVGAGVYNLSGGTNTVANYIGVGRSGGNGVINMTGGVLNKTGNGHLIFGTPYQNPGHDCSGVLNQSGGTINVQSGQVWFPEASSDQGTISGAYNLSGTGVMNVSDWFAIGRNGASGTLTMTGGVINKSGGGQPAMIIADGGGAMGRVTQSAGTINCSSEFWIGQNGGSAIYDLSGTGVLNVTNWFVVGRGANGANGTLNITGGSINQSVNGVFIVGDNSVGSTVQSAGTVSARELWIGQAGGGSGNYDLSGTGSVTINGWVVVGRDGFGTLNMSSGTFTKTGDAGSHFIIASGGFGNVYQTGGNLISTLSDTWVAENGTASWTLSGTATATLSKLVLGLNGAGSGTLSLYGGTMTVKELAGGGGSATVNFGGGLLVAGASGNFIHDLDAANIESAGAFMDTAGYDATVASALLDYGGGGLTKSGLGTLILKGANTYTGVTTVNAGKLVTTTLAAGAGSVAVANGAGFGVQVATDNGQLPVASVGFAGTATTLDMDLNTFGSPAAAPLAIAGALNLNGTVTVNILAASPLQIGVYPLITCGSRTGAGRLTLGALPLNTVANLVDNGTTVSLNVTSVNAPRWEGLAGGNWDIGVTTNWINGGTGLPTYFSEGSEVVFNDEAQGTPSVNLVATVHPTTVAFNNTNLAYTLSGSGKISGATGLSKQGPGTLTIANMANDYTGTTLVGNGALSVANLANSGSPSSIGAGNLVLAGGTLSYTGPAAAINRGYSAQASSTIDAQSDLALSGPVTTTAGSSLTKSGAGRLAYTGAGSNTLAGGTYRVQDGSLLLSGPAAGQTNSITGALSLNGAVAAAAILTNTTLNCGDLYVGNDSGMRGSVTIENGTTINDNSWFILDNGTATINGGTITVPGRLFLCERPGTTATLNINGGVINKNGDYFAVVNGGWNGSGARTGVVNQVSGTVGGGAEMWVGDGGGAGGNDSLGIYNLGGGTLTVNNWMGIGRDGCQGIFNMTGGILNKGGGGDMVIGRGGDNTIGVFNLSGGTLNKSSGNPLIVGQNSGHGLFNHSGGTLNVDSEYWLGVDNNTTDTTNNISGTAVFNVNNWFSQGRGGRAVVNFTGGTITKAGNGNFIIGDGGTGLFEQSGGSLSINNEFWIGQSGSGNGTYNLSAGTVTVGSWVAVGRDGATGLWNMSGGSFTKTGDTGSHFIVGSGGPATLNQTGGTITSVLSDTWVAENSDGTWNLDGGDAVLSVLHIAQNNGRVGVFNLNANGTLTATEVTTGNAGSTSTLNFNGGTLKAANGAAASFLHGLSTATILAGATIDSGTNVVSVAQALLDGGVNGGLTKLGIGTLYLNGVNTYSGATQVKAGALGGSGTIAGPVTVASGAALAPGASVGTLTINNSLDFAAGSKALFEVSLDNGTSIDQVAGLTRVSYAGTLTFVNVGAKPLAVGQVFKLFNCAQAGTGNFSQVQILPYGAGTFNPAKGELTITASVPPTVSGVQVVNGNLVMGLTGGTPNGGFTWLSSTNVAAPLANWVTNSTGTFNATGAASSSLPMDKAQPQKFYRLQVP